MSWRGWWIGLLLAYIATGIFIVPANEKAIARRFGRAVLPTRGSGLHFDLPWPLARIDRVNFHEVRTLALGDTEADLAFIQPTSEARPAMYLTGDKNLLLLRITVQYRISEEFAVQWLYGSVDPVERLESLVETTAADLISQSGVDYVHTLGLAELNNRLFKEVREGARREQLGCEIEQVSIDRADPPARVKAEFLDVSNARADLARSVHDARSYAERTLTAAQADARKLTDQSEQDRTVTTSAARAAADRFEKLIAQLQQDSASGRSYDEARLLVMHRLTLETLSDVLKRAKIKLMLDGNQQTDLVLPQ